MFEKLLGKSKKVSFDLPEKNFVYDSKTVSKLSSKDLILLTTDQDKYITALLKKFDSVKDEYGRMTDKVDELTEKNQIINAQTIKMSNQHQELNVKFNNLENALEIVLREKETIEKEFKGKYTKLKEIIEGWKDFGHLSSGDLETKLKEIVHQSQIQSSVFKNIELQNNKLKEKIEELEESQALLIKSKQKLEISLDSLEKGIFAKDKEMIEIKKQNQKLIARIQELSLSNRKQDDNKQSPEENAQTAQTTLSTLQQKSEKSSLIENIESIPDNMQTEEQNIKEKEIPSQKEENQQKQQNQHAQKEDNHDTLVRLKFLEEQIAKYSLLDDILKETVLRQKKIHGFLTISQQESQNSNQQSNADTLRKNILTLANYLQLKQNHIEMHIRHMEQFKKQVAEQIRIYEEVRREYEGTIASMRQSEQKYLSQKIQILKNNSKLEETLRERNEEMEEVMKKVRKQDTEINTHTIKMESLKKNIDKLNQQNKSYKETIQKKYQESVIYIEKVAQLEEKVKEYKKEIQKQKMERVEVEHNHELKVGELSGKINEFQSSIELIKKESASAQEAKGYEMKQKINRLQEQVEELTKESEVQTKKIEEYEDNQKKMKTVIHSLEQKRQQAIIQIQRLEKLTTGRSLNDKTQTNPDFFIGSKSRQKPKELQKEKLEQMQKQEKADRVKRVAEKSFKAFGIVLKLLDDLYKQFVIDYMSEIKQVRVQKLQNAINKLITKTTDFKDIFKDYM